MDMEGVVFVNLGLRGGIWSPAYPGLSFTLIISINLVCDLLVRRQWFLMVI